MFVFFWKSNIRSLGIIFQTLKYLINQWQSWYHVSRCLNIKNLTGRSCEAFAFTFLQKFNIVHTGNGCGIHYWVCVCVSRIFDTNHRLKTIATRQHSSRMRTARLPTVCVITCRYGRGEGSQVWRPGQVRSWSPGLISRGRRGRSPGLMSRGEGHPTMWPIPWCIWCTYPQPLWTDRNLWKHYLLATSFAGGDYVPSKFVCYESGGVSPDHPAG